MKTVKTPKGTELPLTNLKGKDYLMVAYRLQWFNETETNFTINTEFLKLESDYAIARAAVTIYDKDGRPVKMATATKREDRKDFPDFMEKSETSAVGRALAILGYGTQFAIADLDEGDRLADSPLASPSKSSKPVETSVAAPTTPTLVATKSEVTNDALSLEHTATTVITKKATASSFRKPKKAEANKEAVDGWE